MSAETAPAKLGIVFPKDPIPSEMHRLDRWLASRGCSDVTASTRFTEVLGGHNEPDLRAMGAPEAILPAGKALAGDGCGAVIWACTSASFIGGLDWARDQADALARATGLPSSSTTLAFIDALGSLEAPRAHLLAAYPDDVAAAFVGCLEAAGVAVGERRALGAPDGASSYRLDLAGEAARFAAALPDDGAPILVPDTAIDSLDRVTSLERNCGRCVLTANQVTLWAGLRLLGRRAAIEGAGRLLS
jgi:maleate isomerase